MAGIKSLLKVGDYIWVQPERKEEFYLPWAGKIIIQNDSKIKVINDNGEESWVDSSSVLGEVHTDIRESTDDMISLNDLQEKTLLRNVQIRYLKDDIYTYIGWILIAVNPYKQLPIYSVEMVNTYREKRIGDLPPHLYAIGAQSYQNIKLDSQGQCIIISGESGAGKTESTKLLVNFLANLNERSSLCEQIISANPILEAFGNAKTTKNDNSSRFGKYVEIYFDNCGKVEGACINHYLLEKARIKSQNIGERNYHIFYTMLEGLSQQEKAQLKLSTTCHYHYLKNGSVITCEGRDETQEFEQVKSGLKTLNFSQKDILEIFKLLSAILHLGNLTYNSITADNMEASEVVQCEHLDVILNLLQVVKKDFLEALTQKTMFIGGNKVVSHVSKDQACVNRDGFSMTLYSHVFSFILKQINKIISNQITSRKPSIGILDIFGFENFASNSFEQLCINFANEHLQQFFVEHIFKLEQEEYLKEGIKWQNLEFRDNEEVLVLLGGGQINVMTLIDDETKFPKGDDKGLMVRTHQHFVQHKSFLPSKSEAKLEFGIRHYAGLVRYRVDGFIEKNRNSLSADWLNVVKTCGNEFLKSLFTKELSSTAKGSKTSLIMQYKLSLEMLMATLHSCNPFFIRCIKPNNIKKASVFNHILCCQQLQYLGIMDTAKIRRAGYPIRYSYFEFIQRYRILVPGTPPAHKIQNSKGAAKKICQSVLHVESGDFQFGITKIFLKLHHCNILESEREKLFTKSAIILQRYFRAFLRKKRMEKMLNAAKVIQRYWRAYKPRRDYIVIRRGYLRLQASIRSRQVTHKFKKLKNIIIRFQLKCREYLKRRTLISAPETSPVLIQENVMSVIDTLFDCVDIPMNKNVEVSCRGETSFLGQVCESSTTFSQYAAANFMGNVGCKFYSKPLKQSLLFLPSDVDQMAALALWTTIQRFMGDLSEPKSTGKKNSKQMDQLIDTISASSSLSKNFKEVMNLLEADEMGMLKRRTEEGPTKLMDISLAHKNKLKNEMERLKKAGESLRGSYDKWLWDKTTALEKLHFITGHGILCPELRDEIYCQICKQLTENPNIMSQNSGWYLMYLCCGCFAPSLKFTPVLFNFIESHKGRLQENCRTILQRTLQNGTRNQPPSQFELKAALKGLPLVVEVHLPARDPVWVEIDAATTAHEICSQIFKHINLEDNFGFSLFISIFGSMVSLEDGNCHVMDAISQCEQYAKEKGIPESRTPWKLVICKEMFAPWQDFTGKIDEEASNQIYFQIIMGLKQGNYKCTRDSELALLMAQYYYINYGKEMLNELLTNIIREIMPEAQLNKEGTLAYWSQLIHDYFTKSYFLKCGCTYEMVKRDIIRFAKYKWPLYFSKYYEVKQISGINLEEKSLLLAVNSEGIFFARNNTEIIMKLPYVEISHVELGQSKTGGAPIFQIITIRNHQFSFQSEYAEVIRNLVNWIMEELKSRSKFVVAVSNYPAPDDSFLALSLGDLVILFDDCNKFSEWLKGCKRKTGDIGEFPSKYVKVLPTTNLPPKYVLDWHVQGQGYDGVKNSGAPLLDLRKYTLENYARAYFSTSTGAICKHSKSPISSPLHAKLQLGSHKNTALKIFLAILDYTGDKKISIQKFLTRPVFEPPLQNEILRDELYCQLMKQVTENNNKESEKRGWELLWLAAGLFPCSKNLLKDLRLFLQSRPNVICQETYDRLEKTLEHGSRKHLHHWIEIESVRESTPMFHNVVFPNKMEKLFEVESSTKVGELVDNIVTWLGLIDTLGYCLVVSIEDKTVSLSKDDFLFDAIQDAWVKGCPDLHQKKFQENQKIVYELIFMRKLWINTVPGQDPKADVVCHFHQELVKYLSGCHPCTNMDIIHLASLILLSQIDGLRRNLEQRIKNRLSSLIPITALEGQEGFDWEIPLINSTLKNSGMSPEEAQIAFLKYIEKWPTFGTAFFEVETVPYLLDKTKKKLILGINRNGILVIDSITGKIITTLSYKEMQSCSYSGTTFSVLLDSGKHSWYTNIGFKLADLVDSYLQISNEFMNYYR